MKKVLMVLGCAVGAVALADAQYYSGTGFENIDVGGDFTVQENSSTMWAFSGDGAATDFAAVTAYAEDAAPDSSAIFAQVAAADQAKFRTNDVNAKYLKVETGSDMLLTRRYGATATEVPTTGRYIDTMVQFTAGETAPTPGQTDKLLVWLKANAQDETKPTLVVVAAASASNATATSYEIDNLDADISVDSWYRLTVAFNACDGTYGNILGFKIYLDGKRLSADGTDTFYSLDQASANAATIEGISFAGTGSVDDIVCGTGSPIAEAVNFAVTLDAGVASITYTVAGGEAQTATEGFTITGNLGENLVISAVTYKPGYVAPLVDGTGNYVIQETGTVAITSVLAGVRIANGNYYATFEEALAAAVSGDTIELAQNYTCSESDLIELENKSLTIDLKGCTLEPVSEVYVGVGASLTILDTVGGGSVAYDESTGTPLLTVDEGGALAVDVSATTVFANGAICLANGTLTLAGGLYSAKPTDADGNELADYTEVIGSGKKFQQDEQTLLYSIVADSDEPVETPTIDPATAGSVTVDTLEEAAKVKVVAPADAALDSTEAAAYAELVTTEVVQDTQTGKYVVTAVFAESAVAGLVAEANAGVADLGGQLSGDAVEVTLTDTTPGLYYSVESGTSLPLVNPAETTPRTLSRHGEAVTLQFTRSGEQRFYRVKISPTAN